jgi:hypothetical protein
MGSTWLLGCPDKAEGREGREMGDAQGAERSEGSGKRGERAVRGDWGYLDPRFWVGALMTGNFVLLWAPLIFLQGQIWKLGARDVLRPLFNALDRSDILRNFASKHVYSTYKYTDFFLMSALQLLSFAASFGAVLWYQLRNGRLDWSVVIAYYAAWVGVGGRSMGAAYALAHKEGHNKVLYRKHVRNTIGNVFENVVGPFYGSLPYNFSLSHVHIHHKLNGGKGDTFYQWDLDRTSWYDLMLYQCRILLHTSGVSPEQYFRMVGKEEFANKLRRGMYYYWVLYPTMLWALTQSFSFIFWMYFEPLIAMTYFLAFINFGFHGFLDWDSQGNHIPCVNSTCIIDGDDDYYGEDDHMAHHYFPEVYHSDLPEHQRKQRNEWSKYHASVFRGISIVELSLFVLLGSVGYDKLAEFFVDYNDEQNKLSKEELKHMLWRRAVEKEMSKSEYSEWVRQRKQKYFRTKEPLQVVYSNKPQLNIGSLADEGW